MSELSSNQNVGPCKGVQSHDWKMFCQCCGCPYPGVVVGDIHAPTMIPFEAPSSRALLRLDRAEAEFIVDAAERTRIPQWMDLAANVRQLWGMGAFPAGAVPPG